MLYGAVALASLWFFARLFYRFKESRKIDQAPVDADSVGTGRYRMWFGTDPSRRLGNAYERAREGDPTDLEEIGNGLVCEDRFARRAVGAELRVRSEVFVRLA